MRHYGTTDIHRLLEMGIGRISQTMADWAGSDIAVNENLVLLTLWNWFTTPSARDGKSRLHHHLELLKDPPNGSIVGYTWEDVTAYLVRHWFSGSGTRLDHVFKVVNGSFPFTSEKFQLAQMLTVDGEGAVEAIVATHYNILDGSVQNRNPTETLQQLLPDSNHSLWKGYAIVKPDANMGASVPCYRESTVHCFQVPTSALFSFLPTGLEFWSSSSAKTTLGGLARMSSTIPSENWLRMAGGREGIYQILRLRPSCVVRRY